jgi:hypothetical protein
MNYSSISLQILKNNEQSLNFLPLKQHALICLSKDTIFSRNFSSSSLNDNITRSTN